MKNRIKIFRNNLEHRPAVSDIIDNRLAPRIGGDLELAYYRAAGDGQAFPTRER